MLKMKKIILLTFCMILLIGIVSPTSFIYKQGDIVNQRIRCFDSNNNYCGSGTICYGSIEDPDGDTALNNVSLTFNPTYYNITVPTNKTGTYSFIRIYNDIITHPCHYNRHRNNYSIQQK